MNETKVESTSKRGSTSPVGMVLAFLFALLYLFFGAAEARAQEIHAAGAGDTLHITLEGNQGSETFGEIVTVLPNGNFVVIDPLHDTSNKDDIGSVTLYDGDSLKVISRTFGVVEESLVGNGGIVILADGNFVIRSPFFALPGALAVGAVTWCSAETGCPNHVTPENSLTGSTQGDRVGWVVVPLGDSGFLAQTSEWHHAGVANAGAVTRCLPVSACVGLVVDAENSLVGSTIGDNVGSTPPVILANGDYVVAAPHWDFEVIADAGAVIRCPMVGDPCHSQIEEEDALIGAQSGDRLGSAGVVAAGNGYIVASPYVDFGANADAGAVTFCETSCIGAPSGANSLMSGTASDALGAGGVKVVGNGAAYVVVSHNWNNAAVVKAGAVTYCPMSDPCKGFIVKARSLYGSSANDMVGGNGVTVLANGDYIVASANWSSAVAAVGAVTWCSGASGCLDQAVSAANSVYGTSIADGVGGWGVQALSGGSYIISSLGWDNGGVADAGALTWCPEGGCTPAPVGMGNSLVGGQTLDQVGLAKVLPNGNYVAHASFFNNGLITDAGMVALCDGDAGCSGPMFFAIGMAGSVPGQRVGNEVAALSNGHFLVRSNFDLGGDAGVDAVTWCNGETGCPGQVGAMNSVYGVRANDDIGSGGLFATGSGDAVLFSPAADGDALPQVGAITWMRGNQATGASMADLPSVYGAIAGAGASLEYAFNDLHNYLIVGVPTQGKVVVVMARPSLFVSKAGNGIGTVMSSTGGIDCGSDCLESAASGATISLTATPAASSNFVGWSGACSGTGACDVTLQGATQVAATFAIKLFTVNLPGDTEGGTVSVSVVAMPAETTAASAEDGSEVSAAEMSAVYAYGTVIQLTAKPDPDYLFESWTGDYNGDQNPLQFSVTQDRTIGALFRPVGSADPDLDIFLPLINK